MTVRRKTTLIIAAAMLGLIGTLHLASSDPLRRRLAGIEEGTPQSLHNKSKAESWTPTLVIAAACCFFGTMILLLVDRAILARVRTVHNMLQRLSGQTGIVDQAPARGRDELTGLADVLGKVNTIIRETGMRLAVCEEHCRRLEQARDSAEKASHAKSESLANMSHEIRTPLTSILGYADLLMDADQSPSERLNCLHTIRRNGEHLLNILNDILDLSKIEAGRMELDIVPCSPHETVREVALLLRRRAADKNLTLETRYLGPIPQTIRTDPTRLRQILINLVGNAIKFTRQGGIRIEVQMHGPPEAESGLIRIAVIDTGIGMTPEQLSRLFRPFVQAESSTTRQFGGTGLGLTISKRLAEALGGGITVESVSGKGSTLTVTIDGGPLSGVELLETDPTAGDVTGLQALSRDLRNLNLSGRILLAEDGLDNQHLVSVMLKKVGLTVTVCDNGEAAVQLAREALAAGLPFDVILMDMHMPVLDGYDATRELRRGGYAGAIVALTANAMTADREKCRRAGCSEFLPKPIERSRLLKTMARFIRKAEDLPMSPDVPPEDAVPPPKNAQEDPTRFVRDFVEALPGRIETIRQLAAAHDSAALIALVQELHAQAARHGLEAIGRSAEKLEHTARVNADLKELEIAIQDLAGLCRRAGTVGA